MSPYDDLALALHKKYQGKYEMTSKIAIDTPEDLATAYTPGVAAPCLKIKEDEEQAYTYTTKANTIAVVTNGTAVLGLGDIGAKASLPVMEGKAILFKHFGNVNAIPIPLDTKDPETFIKTVKLLAPAFGGINLEDIKSPECFYIEETLKKELDIPVFHDDQHGTAIVVCAGLVNALKLTNKKMAEIKIVVNGPGAAGTAIIHLLYTLGVKHLIACDEHGILTTKRDYGNQFHKKEIAQLTNISNDGSLKDAVKDADVFIGVSVAGALTKEMVSSMSKDPIVFALANPNPEITVADAKEAGVTVMATGRSDFPNQINNVLVFPGVFKGALKVGATEINDDMKVAATFALANSIPEERLKADYVIPSIFEGDVSNIIADAVAKVAVENKITRRL